MKNIAFEGIDGSGKSMQLKMQYLILRERYGENNIGICHLNSLDNFTGSVVKRLYGLPKNPLTKVLNNRVVQETLYALCARSSLRKTRGLNKDILLSDRSLLTPFAHHIGKIPEWYLTFVEPDFYPDLVVYINVSPEIGLERILRRDGPKTTETLERLKRFREGYELVIGPKKPRALDKTKVLKVNGEQPLGLNPKLNAILYII